MRMAESAGASLPAGRIAFTYPDFTIYQAARFFIVAALEMQSVAVGWQVYEITRTPLDLGLIGLAQFLPGMLLFLVSGHVAERFYLNWFRRSTSPTRWRGTRASSRLPLSWARRSAGFCTPSLNFRMIPRPP